MRKINFILISAVSIDGVIGVDNEIPWRIPEDFKHFRNTTMGNMLLVGYNTFLTLPEKAFEGREYMVIHGDKPIDYDKNPNIYHFRDLDTAFHLLEDEKTDIEKIYVIGGAMIYDTMIDHCNEAIITWVNKDIPNGNKYFPITKLFTNFEIAEDQQWQMSKTGIEYRIVHYKRKK